MASYTLVVKDDIKLCLFFPFTRNYLTFLFLFFFVFFRGQKTVSFLTHLFHIHVISCGICYGSSVSKKNTFGINRTVFNSSLRFI